MLDQTSPGPASGRITQVKTDRCHLDGPHKGKGYNERPRLCVALDYLHVMSDIPDKGGRGSKGAIEVPLRFKPAYLISTGKLEIALASSLKI